MQSASQAGILNPGAAPAHFELRRHAPATDLADLVERHWIVRWDLRGREPHLQETLPHPCVNLVVQAGCSAVHGCGTRKFSIVLADAGQVFGVKFRPGGFFPFVQAPVAQFTDRSTPLTTLFGPAAAALEPTVLATRDDREQIELVEEFLREQLRGPVPGEVARVVGIVQLALERREITSAEALAAQVNLTPRTLQRLFKKYVGVGPKWTIRRYRLHEAAERLADGAPVDWAAMAQDLGYFDQAHFIRDFKAQIGRSPGEYAAECAAHPRTVVSPAPSSTADCDSDPSRPAAR
jgi:AraC-like DNA-binding protein